MAFSHDSAYFATGGDGNRKAAVWEVTGGAKLLELECEAGLSSVAFSHDSAWLATGDGANKATIWDAKGGAKVLEVACEAAIGSVALVAPQSSRSSLTASGLGAPKRCTVNATTVEARLRRHAADKPYVSDLLEAPFLEGLLREDATRRLLSMRGSVKEVCEAYSVAQQVRELSLRAGGSAEAVSHGAGVVILDVCSGKGLTALLLSRCVAPTRGTDAWHRPTRKDVRPRTHSP